ncbi:MFS transporter [Shinella yambaruensis]|uniref:MFS transporter n=1 Tax=Shinella yambaruensis TaxID=415996 RepID=A0ABQ5ZVM1_9HYPH|nr:MFS transporter [Shinella yambaruensis]MCJ8027552.1 MFS transporter [Shinella yambaruensis]MCU7982844.1 MFS transporter [Shinella yambaruensis]GLR54648.1 MFS transporter [Shinella yambaruensis]
MKEPLTSAGAADLSPAPGARLDTWSDLLSGRHLVIVAILASGVLLYAMNLYFTAALMPSIVADIGGQAYYAWVTTSFVVSAIVASLFVSRMLDWKGPGPAYVLAFLVFALGAAGNAASPTMEFLIVGRVVQGLGGGLLAGLGYAVIRAALPERHWARGTGAVSAMWGLGTLFGPALGGIFAELGLWRWAYGALAIVALLFALLAQRAFAGMGGSQHRTPVPVASLVPLVLATVAISLSAIVPIGWPTLATVGAGLVLLVLFVLVERRARNTILPRITYRRGNALKWVYLTVAALSAGVMVETFIPLFSQQLAGVSPLVGGLLGAVLSLAWVIAQLLVVSVTSPAGQRRAVRTGPLLLTAGLIAYGLLQVAGAGTGLVVAWVAVLALAGAGIGLAWPLLGVAAMSSTHDPAEGGKAAAAITTTQLIAFSVTSALAGTLMAAGGDVAVDAARYVVLGIALLTLLGILTAGIATRR